IAVFGFIWKSGRRLTLDGHSNVEHNVKQATQNVRKQIVQFLNISSVNENYIQVQSFGYITMKSKPPYVLAQTNITIDKVMLIENRINATCQSFEQLIEACLKSPFGGNNTSHYGSPVDITGKKERHIYFSSMLLKILMCTTA
ncbi:hypothetical protein PHET_12358, partial [Paragonimus heterotremus]